jgi:hypothetical protein
MIHVRRVALLARATPAAFRIVTTLFNSTSNAFFWQIVRALPPTDDST